MQIELEKKYNLSENDYKIIREKCKFVEEIILKDYYLDKDYILSKKHNYLRIRNGVYEYKDCSMNPKTKLVTCEELINEDDINKRLKEYNLNIDDTTGIIFIDTKREKYKYNYKGYDLNIDVEEYQYGTRYEIEIVYEEEGDSKNRTIIENKLNTLIEDFRNELGLSAETGGIGSKIITCAMHQDIELYEIYTGNKI